MTLRMTGLVPSVIAVKDEVSISEAAEFYKDDLPWPNLMDEESSEDEKISGGQKYYRADQILWQNH